MEKIVIVGCPGAGKTTFALQLGKKLHIPVHHLDFHFWREDWTHPSQEEFRNIQTQLMQEKSWILEGNFKKSVDHRIPKADTVILFDFPKIINLWRTLKRFFEYRGNVRPDMGGENKESLQWKHIKYIIKYPRETFKNHVIAMARGKRVIIFRNPRQVTDFLESI